MTSMAAVDEDVGSSMPDFSALEKEAGSAMPDFEMFEAELGAGLEYETVPAEVDG